MLTTPSSRRSCDPLMPRAKLRTPALKDRVVRAAVSTLAEERSHFTTRRVARDAGTSPAAIYELFDDRGGLLRAAFFDGFRLLGSYFADVEATDDPVDDLRRMFRAFRAFTRENPGLADLMFSRPFPDFQPGPEEAAAGTTTGLRNATRAPSLPPMPCCILPSISLRT